MLTMRCKREEWKKVCYRYLNNKIRKKTYCIVIKISSIKTMTTISFFIMKKFWHTCPPIYLPLYCLKMIHLNILFFVFLWSIKSSIDVSCGLIHTRNSSNFSQNFVWVSFLCVLKRSFTVTSVVLYTYSMYLQ